MGRKALGSIVLVFGLVAGATSLSAQAVRVGGQVSFADDADFGIGPRLQFELPSIATGLWVAGSFDYFFPDDGFLRTGEDFDYWEINANLLYDIDIPDATNVRPYFGAGVNLARTSVTLDGETSSDSRLGLNLAAGLNFPLRGVTPFFELRIEIEGGEQFVIAGGIMFP